MASIGGVCPTRRIAVSPNRATICFILLAARASPHRHDRYAVWMYSRSVLVSWSISSTRLLTTSPIDTMPISFPAARPVPVANPSGWPLIENQAILLWDQRYLQTYWFRPTSTALPWQNGYAERLIGSIRRECVDHIIVLGERHLRHVLLSYMKYYNEIRTHLSLRRMRPYRVPLGPSVTFFAARSWAGCITNMSGFDLRQAQRHPAFNPCPKSYPRRSELRQNCYSRAGDEQSAGFLPASKPRKPLKPRSLYVIFLVEKDMRVKRRRTCDYHHHKKI